MSTAKIRLLGSWVGRGGTPKLPSSGTSTGMEEMKMDGIDGGSAWIGNLELIGVRNTWRTWGRKAVEGWRVC